MLTFLKKWLNQNPDPEELKEHIKEESVLPAGEAPLLAEAADQKSIGEQLQATPLSLHQTWEKRLSMQEKYSLSFMASELVPIAPGNISLAGIGMAPHDEGIVVTAFVRNVTPHPVQLQTMNLVVLTNDNRVFSRQSFDLSELGEIPAFHARPWEFLFRRENFLIVDLLLLNWKLAFEIAEKKLVLPQQLELEESWIKALNDEQKNSLIELAKRLPALQPGEVNIQSVQITHSNDASLRAMLLIRNGSDKALSFEKLPLALIDAAGDVVAQGLFQLEGLTINPGTSKPWLFIFPPESIIKQEPDLSRWSVKVPQE